MPASWNDFKTTNPAYFPVVLGVPAWRLSIPANPWDSLMDGIANLHAPINGNQQTLSNFLSIDVIDASSNTGMGVTSGVGAAAFRLYTTDPAAGNRNWVIRNRFTSLGMLEFSVGASLGAAPTLVALGLTPTSVQMPLLPNANPGAGTKQLWYDPADSNRVKFAA